MIAVWFAANGFFVIRVKEETIDPHYLLAYLQSTEVNAWMEDRARGTAAKHLSVDSISKLPIALPPLQIQQRTAEQHRKFGVDALTYLAELLTEDDSGALAAALNDWVARSLKRLESYEGDPNGHSVLELLEEVAASRCPINTCKECKLPYHLDYSTSYIDPPTDYAKGIETHCLECWMGLEPRAAHIPEVDTVLFLRPTESLTVFLQQLGRGLRLHPDKECLTVLDFIGAQRKEFRFASRFRALTLSVAEVRKRFGLTESCG